MTKKRGENITYEISVDRANEKGVFVAREMLSTLHHTLGHDEHRWQFWKKREQPDFRFEVLSIEGRIRFLFTIPRPFASFLTSQLYAHYSDVEIVEIPHPIPEDTRLRARKVKIAHLNLETIKLYVNLKDRTEKDMIDPLSSMTSALTKVPRDAVGGFMIEFRPVEDSYWRTPAKRVILKYHLPQKLKVLLLSYGWMFRTLFFPFRLVLSFIGLLFPTEPSDSHEKKEEEEEMSKTESFGYLTDITLIKSASESLSDEYLLKEIAGSLNIFANPQGNTLKVQKSKVKRYGEVHGHLSKHSCLWNATELAGIVHLPTLYVKTPGIQWVTTRKYEPPHELPSTESPNTPIGRANYRGEDRDFGIQPVDRARHIYVIGKTGMGKSTLLENMIYTDILNGRGVGVIDPHGDLVETILRNIPKSRTNDIILFDPADQDFPIGFNMLENTNPQLRPIVAGGLVSIFKKMFAESWWPRLEYILRNTILTLLLVPETTLISIPLILTHESYRKKIVAKLEDPILTQFWTQEFEKMSPSMMSEAVSPILNKVGQFLSSPLLRNILGQPKNPFSLRWVMDNGKIFLVNLSKGRIGEDASALLGAMMVTKFQIEAMTRADIPESERRDFGLYVDEFQNFATDSFATILSEARKYRLSLTMANQYIAQMPETVQGAVFGNVGSLVSFQVGYHDAVTLAEVYGGEEVITPQDLTNLRKYDIYTKLLISGMPSPVFSATTYAPLHERIDVPLQQEREVLQKVSREKYTKKKDFVEKKIFDTVGKIRDEERQYRIDQEKIKERIKDEKERTREKEKEKKEKEKEAENSKENTQKSPPDYIPNQEKAPEKKGKNEKKK